MTHEPRSYVRGLTLVVGWLLVGSGPEHAAAQSPFDDWREPVVVELKMVGGKDGKTLRPLGRGRIRLGPRESFAIEIDPFDQSGRRFPRDRFQIGLELHGECDGRVTVAGTGGAVCPGQPES